MDLNILWEFIRDGSTRPPYLSREELYADEATELEMEQLAGLKLGKEYVVTRLI